VSAEKLEDAIKKGDGLQVAILMASATQLEISRALLLACSGQKEYTHIVSLLIVHGADIECVTYSGWTPLHRASIQGHAGYVSLLIGRGANVNTKGMEDWTALHWACYNGRMECVKLLVASGADIHFKTSTNETPLDIARDNEHNEVVKYLEALPECR